MEIGFKLIEDPRNWTEAQAACENVEGKFFSELQQSIDQYDYIINLLNANFAPVWIGIRWDGDGYWRSLEGRIIPNDFLNWADGEPLGSPLSERAIMIHDGQSHDERYSEEFYPLCEILL